MLFLLIFVGEDFSAELAPVVAWTLLLDVLVDSFRVSLQGTGRREGSFADRAVISSSFLGV